MNDIIVKCRELDSLGCPDLCVFGTAQWRSAEDSLVEFLGRTLSDLEINCLAKIWEQMFPEGEYRGYTIPWGVLAFQLEQLAVKSADQHDQHEVISSHHMTGYPSYRISRCKTTGNFFRSTWTDKLVFMTKDEALYASSQNFIAY